MTQTTNTAAFQDDARAWGDFWANSARSGGGGCLPERWAAIESAQQKAWADFVADLPQGARVLDLATGDGAVLRWMRAARADLSLTGIDLAPTLPTPPVGTEIRGGIAMEHLPFGDGGFDAVVSQFGFEYGDARAIAAEIGRVLAPQGRVGLIVHRGDGPILEHNRSRQRELLWALRDKSTAKKAKALLARGPKAIPKALKLAEDVAKMGAEKFGQTSPAWEVPEAIRRSVMMGARVGPVSIIETIETIETQAKNELGRIASLARACGTADDRDALHAAFADVSRTHQSTQAIYEPSGRALADFLTFS